MDERVGDRRLRMPFARTIKIDPNQDALALIDEMEVAVDDIDGSGEQIANGLDTALDLFGDLSNATVAASSAANAPPNPNLREGEASRGASGIYPVLGSDNIFYQPLLKQIVACGDAVEGDPMSNIEVKRTFTVPEDRLAVEWDKVIGLTMLYDGRLAFATNYGLIGVITRDFRDAKYLQISDDEGEARDLGEDENTWTLEAVDWETGDSEWYLPIGELGQYNSAFAAVQVVEGRHVDYGTFFGLQRIRP